MNLMKYNLQILTDLANDWIQVTSLAVSHSNHYTRMFYVLLWDYKLNPIHAWVILSNLSN